MELAWVVAATWMENVGAELVVLALLDRGLTPKAAAAGVVPLLLGVSPVANTGVKLNFGAA